MYLNFKMSDLSVTKLFVPLFQKSIHLLSSNLNCSFLVLGYVHRRKYSFYLLGCNVPMRCSSCSYNVHKPSAGDPAKFMSNVLTLLLLCESKNVLSCSHKSQMHWLPILHWGCFKKMDYGIGYHNLNLVFNLLNFKCEFKWVDPKKIQHYSVNTTH